MKLPRSSLIWFVLIVCLTLFIFAYLTRKSLCEIRNKDGCTEVATFMADTANALKRLYKGASGSLVAPFLQPGSKVGSLWDPAAPPSILRPGNK
ncbi:type I toxin-antitoxin system Hok family toxin [Escherichia coli]|nr:type I toxin-antitoxin system Hok family toxin [Escherichia coli]